MWVADTDTGQITAELEDFSQPGGARRVLLPVRFSEDNSVLFYSLQPVGLGGAWSAFSGRYDSLFSTSTAGGAVTSIFECATLELFLCLGDFYQLEGQVLGLTYVDDKTKSIVVLNNEGQTLNTLTPGTTYVGYPTYSPQAELVYMAADLSEESINPLASTIYRVAPPVAPAEVVVSDPGLLPIPTYYSDTGLAIGYVASDGMSYGQGVVDMTSYTFQPLSEWPIAILAGVLP
jgi:hypothetical protein